MEAPLGITVYSKDEADPLPIVASFSNIASGDEKVHIKVKHGGKVPYRAKPKDVLASSNERAMDFKKVNMRKRILTEESRRACGDEDKVF